ncbi:MAG: hypothetical protein WCJ30_28165, partial [Deltaproteobacteria bacterium]
SDPEYPDSEALCRGKSLHERYGAIVGAGYVLDPPVWNPPSGRPVIDGLRWFDYVHVTAPLTPGEA